MEDVRMLHPSPSSFALRALTSQGTADKASDSLPSSSSSGLGQGRVPAAQSPHPEPHNPLSRIQSGALTPSSSSTAPLSNSTSSSASKSLKRPHVAHAALEPSAMVGIQGGASAGAEESVSQGRSLGHQQAQAQQAQLDQLQKTLSKVDSARAESAAQQPDFCAYSDRFIPSRSASNWCSMRLWESQASDWSAAAAMGPGQDIVDSWGGARSSLGRNGRGGAENGDEGSMAAAYSMLLKSELLGLGGAPGGATSPTSRVTAAGMFASPAQRIGGGVMMADFENKTTDVAGGGNSSRNMLRFRRRGGPLQAMGGGGGGGGPLGGPGAGEPGVASWLGQCDAPLSLSPLGSDADVASSRTAPFLSPSVQKRKQRKIARSPYKVLDAPALQDDFYLNLVDWSSQNVLAVGLGSCTYLWSAATSRVTKLCDVGSGDSVCSVSWTHRGTYLSVGTSNGDVQIWDVARGRKLRSMAGHTTRVGALSWSSSCLASGSRDHSILMRDIRAPEDYSLRLQGHRSEVCGLKWSPDERELASGGNDNQLLVWSAAASQGHQPLLRFSAHTAAVKAIAWSPHQHGLLASGGGTADRTVRFWSTQQGSSLSWVDTGSQVCNLAWSKNANELVSTHGYSQNQIVVWRYPSMSKLATLTGHTMRVLFLAMSPDGQTIVTGAGDETLRFWNVFPGPKADSPTKQSVFSSPKWVTIR